MGFAQWRKRPKGGVEEPLPKWLVEADAKVTTGDVITPNRSASLAFALAALNPKAIALVLATSIVVFKSSSTFVDTLLDFYRDNGAKVCLFTVSDRWRATQILGKINSLETVFENYAFSTIAFEIRGVPQQ